MLSRLCAKSFKLGFSSTWTDNIQMYKLGFKEAEKPEIKLPTFVGWWRRQETCRETSASASLTTLKPLTVHITTNCGKFLKRWKYQTTLPVSWETCMWVKKQQLEPYMEQVTGSKLRKEYYKAVHCHPTYLTYMHSTSREMLGWRKHKLEIKIAGRNINNFRYADDTRKWRGTKKPPDESERGEWKSWLKAQHSEN